MFVDVPNVPGVPPVLRDPALGFSNDLEFMTADDIDTYGQPPEPQWGIFKNGVPQIVADSVVTMDFRQEYDVSDYPVELGAFQSYNKVASPFTARVRFATGGKLEDRTDLLNGIDAITGDTEVYDLHTPEKTYNSVNVTHYDYERSSTNGVGLIMVDVYITEIRNTAQQSFSQVKSPSGASPVANGTVQPKTPTGDQATKAAGAWKIPMALPPGWRIPMSLTPPSPPTLRAARF
jgi:hypothetical protein